MKDQSPGMIYALRNGETVYIDDVESGLKCGCICPRCKEPLIARKGKIVTHHFAHKPESNCDAGFETSLHLLAKDILSKAGKIRMPEIFYCFPNVYKNIYYASRGELLKPERELIIDDIVMEKSFFNVRPDIAILCGNEIFFIEIYVTHGIDDDKLKKLQKIGVSAIEIDLSDLKDQPIIPYRLKNLLVNDTKRKRWIYNREKYEFRQKLLSIAEKKIIDVRTPKTRYKYGRGYRYWHERKYVVDCPINARLSDLVETEDPDVEIPCQYCPYCVEFYTCYDYMGQAPDTAYCCGKYGKRIR